jgi:hypothetical protein
MTTVIEGKALDQFQIAPDGTSVSLGLRDTAGQSVAVSLPIDCVNALMMTLPSMVAQALRARHRDSSLRMVFPLGQWTVESAAADERVILTLSTPDGFTVSFGITPDELTRIGSAAAEREEADRLSTN